MCNYNINTLSGPVASTYGQIVTGTACGTYSDGICTASYSLPGIQMKNCGSYNVYYLKKATGCYVCYCMGKNVN